MIGPITFKATLRRNTWIYVAKTELRTIVTCPNSSEMVLLQGVGSIHLDNKCKIQTGDITLQATSADTVIVLHSIITLSPLPSSSIAATQINVPVVRSREEFQLQPVDIEHHQLRKTVHVALGIGGSGFLVIILLIVIAYYKCIKPKLRIFRINGRTANVKQKVKVKKIDVQSEM